MNILVTGANGQLGNEIRIVSRHSNDFYLFTDVNIANDVETTYLDITDLEHIRKIVKDNNITAIINCAAWTDVDSCEVDDRLAAVAEKLNAHAPENLAIVMKEVNGWLIHISTDYVFGAEKLNLPCTPNLEGRPCGVYGITKLNGEQRIISSGCKYVIIRTSWLYSEFGKNFCKTMLNLTATKKRLKVVFDQCGTPTYALDLANAIITIIDRPQVGIYHFSNEGVTSWYDFAKMIARLSGNLDCDIQPCYSSEYTSNVKRPAYSVLDKFTIKEAFDVKVPYWVDSLEACIKNIQKG